MIIENKFTKKEYRKLILQELIFGRKSILIMLGLYCVEWRVLYSIAKVGLLKRNIPIFLGVGFLFIVTLIYIGITYHRHMKNSFLYTADSQISMDDSKLVIQSSDSKDNFIYTWDSLIKIKEDRKWYFLFFKDKSFLPISKKLGDNSSEELKEYLKVYKPIRKTYKKLLILAFLLITIGGIYYVGTCAVNFNGDLSWKIKALKEDKDTNLEDTNFYNSKLKGIIDSVKDKTELEPHLMTNSLDVKFKKDGTITSIETYIYGFDKDYKLKSGYLLYYDKSKESKITIHKQDWAGGGTMKYDSANDLSIVIDILSKIPVKNEVKQWNEESYGITYKGIRSWGYNLEGIRFINSYGKITIPSSAPEEIKGPTISVYCPGKEQTIIPHRFVYKASSKK